MRRYMANNVALLFVVALTQFCSAVPDQVHLALAGPNGMSVTWVTQIDVSSACSIAPADTPDDFRIVTTEILDDLDNLIKEDKCLDENDACEASAACSHVLSAVFCEIPDDIADGPDMCWTRAGFVVGSAGFDAFSDLVDCIRDNSLPSTISFREEFIHTVTFEELDSNTEYVYSCGDPVDGMTSPKTFKTGLAPGDKTPFDVLIVGDVGTGDDDGRLTTDAFEQDNDSFDFVWHMGDLGYADDFFNFPDGVQNFKSYPEIMDEFMRRLEPVASQKPYMTAVGNHEQLCDEGVDEDTCPLTERNYTGYRTVFTMPFEISGSTSNMWYSFDYGLVHFISIDTETDFPNSPDTADPDSPRPAGPFGDQLGWLEQDLQKANDNRDNVPWIFAGGHRPLYSTAGGCEGCREAFEPLFQKYNLDIYFCGHVHWYERMFQISDNVVTPSYTDIESTVYLLSGSGGNLEGHDLSNNPIEEFTAVINRGEFGYGILSVVNETNLEWKWKKSADLEVADEVLISRSPSRGISEDSTAKAGVKKNVKVCVFSVFLGMIIMAWLK